MLLRIQKLFYFVNAVVAILNNYLGSNKNYKLKKVNCKEKETKSLSSPIWNQEPQ